MSLRIRIGRCVRVGLLALVAVAAFAGGRAQTQSSGGGLIPRGAAEPDAALLYTGDVIGFLDPCG